ncbi:hypothetical protein GobsT_09090 [Gemmata obscuriglobus]|uniref:Glycosyltransferase RgtA/B/C/D-like domain-containing protein n=1 Tax=Gemmata obscuriglobus TaxID=114 RepID=A0A2Z3H6N8_9BACT|nr:hypothetical protein [Gemmata obscuriglobus]AWM40571.1 hypothetical protein C1280_28710 [Gemmata obscuriglobus]QEG26170.1 hypothetical protein GobsT_09090 [Gemmata obscuriglobus]VTS00793.1 Glycosyl transferase family protein OS=uncultured bacterium GN=ACD_58C00035G0004 PE=4 SV=1 [Gemmata obscuriglobus UQM 2246]
MRGRWADALWLLAVGVASSVWCVTAAAQLGATFDEPLYVKAGLTSWRTGSNKLLMRAGTMPLPIDVQTLPAYLWEQHRGREFDPVLELHTVLPVCRATNLVFWWLALAYSMRLGRAFGGAWGGRIAVTLVGCDPNFLGHAALATTDTALLALMLVLVYHAHYSCTPDARWARRVLAPGLLYGLAITAKASAMVFGAQALFVLGLWNLARAGALTPPGGGSVWRRATHCWHATYQFRKDLVATAFVGFVFVFAYCGSDWGTEPTFIKWADGLPEGRLKDVMGPVSQNLKIFTNAGEALLHQIKHNIRGHGTYLLGTWHQRATPAYFPVALSMKVPVPALVLLLAALVTHPRRLLLPTAGVALVLLAFTPNCRVQIGIRFVFVLMALTYITVAAAIARGWAELRAGTRAVPRPLVVASLAALVGTAAWVWPHGLSYFNQLWGGTPAGDVLLHDSNYDWGQGLPELRRWNAEHNGGEPLGLWYFGTDPDTIYPPVVWLHLSHIPLTGNDDTPTHCPTKYLAVSVAILSNNPAPTPAHKARLEWIKTQTPVARTTHFFIYRVRE